MVKVHMFSVWRWHFRLYRLGKRLARWRRRVRLVVVGHDF